MGNTAGGVGYWNFISHSRLEGRYLSRDQLHFHISKVEILPRHD